MKLAAKELYTIYALDPGGLGYRMEVEMLRDCYRPDYPESYDDYRLDLYTARAMRTRHNPGRNLPERYIEDTLDYDNETTLIIRGINHPLLSVEWHHDLYLTGTLTFLASPSEIMELMGSNVNSHFRHWDRLMSQDPNGSKSAWPVPVKPQRKMIFQYKGLTPIPSNALEWEYFCGYFTGKDIKDPPIVPCELEEDWL